MGRSSAFSGSLRKDLLVDEPFYCTSCGSQFYVSGGLISLNRGRKVRLYSLEDAEGEVHSCTCLRCPDCMGSLSPLEELEKVFGDTIRSF